MKGALFVSRYMKTEKLWVLFHRVAIRHTGCVYKWDISMKVKESFAQSAGHPCHSSSCWSDKILTISWSINMQLWIIGLYNMFLLEYYCLSICIIFCMSRNICSLWDTANTILSLTILTWYYLSWCDSIRFSYSHICFCSHQISPKFTIPALSMSQHKRTAFS